jgi:hypothetical protein
MILVTAVVHVGEHTFATLITGPVTEGTTSSSLIVHLLCRLPSQCHCTSWTYRTMALTGAGGSRALIFAGAVDNFKLRIYATCSC